MKADIVIINYQDKQRVERAIESAINQTWKETNVIVVDDGSDKETRELYKKYSDKIELVQLERTDKTARTPSRARNAGIDKATGDFICFLDSDNYYEPDFIEETIKHNKDYVFCNWEIVGLEQYKVYIEQVWRYKDILQNYLSFQHLDHQCILFKRSYLDKIGYYDERLPRSQDCDLIARAIMGGGEYFHTAKKLFVFEKHETDQSKQYASVYGKTMWTLKNNINIQWLIGLLNDPMKVLSYQRAISDFINEKKWESDYNNSEFKSVVEKHREILKLEQSENA